MRLVTLRLCEFRYVLAGRGRAVQAGRGMVVLASVCFGMAVN